MGHNTGKCRRAEAPEEGGPVPSSCRGIKKKTHKESKPALYYCLFTCSFKYCILKKKIVMLPRVSLSVLEILRVSQVRTLARSPHILEDDLVIGRFLFLPQNAPCLPLSHVRTPPGSSAHRLSSPELRGCCHVGRPLLHGCVTSSKAVLGENGILLKRFSSVKSPVKCNSIYFLEQTKRKLLK